MFKFGRTLVAAIAVLVLVPAVAQAAQDVPTTDWSYGAVQDLATRGLIEGYPKNTNLFQGRTVNRYEMAALVGRAIARLAEIRSAGGPLPSADALAELGKLLAEFKVELAVMGTDIADVDLGPTNSTVNVLNQPAPPSPAPQAATVGSFMNSIHFTTLLQEWYATGSDVTDTGKNPGAISNTFRIRRAEFRFQGNPAPKVYFNVMLDTSRNLSLNATTAKTTIGGTTITTTTYSIKNANVPLQDCVLGYNVTPTLAVEGGQQKVPMSIEGYRPAWTLLTVERSLMNDGVAYNQGQVGDIRDQGAMLRFVKPHSGTATLAVMNDAGADQNQVDDNNFKSVMYNGQVTAIRNLQFGGWGELPSKDGNPTVLSRRRAGLDFDYVNAANELTGEYENGQDGIASSSLDYNSKSAYGIFAHKFSSRLQGVIREDWFQGIGPATVASGAITTSTIVHNDEHDLTLGVNYYAHGNNEKFQLNYIRKTIGGPLTPSSSATVGPQNQPTLGISRDQWFLGMQQWF